MAAQRIYLDHNATTPTLVAVRRAMATAPFGNAGSAHAEGRAAEAAVGRARRAVAQLIGAAPEEVVFTSGGTEADNLAVLGGACDARKGPRSSLCGLVTTTVEHKAILTAGLALERTGAQVRRTPVERDGSLRLDVLAGIIEEVRPALVSVMLAQNEVGNVYPVADVARIGRAAGALIHSDAVNALGKIPVNVGALDVDLLSLSAHKIGGPKGIGALWIRGGPTGPLGLRLRPIVLGGGQEGGLRPGTLAVPSIVGFGVAARIARARLDAGNAARVRGVRDLFGRMVLDSIQRAYIVGTPDLPNTLALAFDGLDARAVVAALDEVGVAASAGSACGCKEPKPSHVMEALDGPPTGAVRFSFGAGTNEEEAYDAARRVVRRVRHLYS